MSLSQRIWKHLNSKAFVIPTFAVMLLLLAKTSNNFYDWTNNNAKAIKPYNLEADGAAYYSYVTEWFINSPSNKTFFDTLNSRYPGNRFYDQLYINEEHDEHVNKYYSGTAIAITPFFLIAHGIESIRGERADGYSIVYQVFVSLAALFYWLLGAIALYLFLLRLKIPRFYIALVICFITFGTHLSHFIIYEPACSHTYSFAVIAWILFTSERWVATNKTNYFYLLGFLLGFAFLIRPTNLIIVLFIPFLFGTFDLFYRRLKLTLSKKVVTFLIFLFFLSLPVLFHFWDTFKQTGGFQINTYREEGFDHLLNPYIYEVLFGVRKGLFFYSPLLLLSVFGLFYLYKLKKHLMWGSLLVFSVYTYIISSWWCWWYGGGFSMRPFIDIMAIFTLPIAFLLVHANKVIRVLLILVGFACIYLTQTYSYQVSRNILHYDNITREDFSDVFLQTDKRFEWYAVIDFDEVPDNYSETSKTFKFDKNELTIPISTYSNKSDSIAGSLKGRYKILNEKIFPSYKIIYFLKGSVIEEFIHFGGKIPKVGKEKYLTLELYPEIEAKQIDSITIQKQWINEDMKAWDIELNLLKKKNND